MRPLWSPSGGGGYLPVGGSSDPRCFSRSHIPRFFRNVPATLILLAITLVTGLLGGYTLAGPAQKAELCSLPLITPTVNSTLPPLEELPQADLSVQEPLLVSDDWDLEALHSMVASTRGYYARDFSMSLGWNNMRYIIETALHHGSLLNRTVIIPSYIYARSCEYANAVCAAYAPMVNRGDAINSDEWRQLPEEQQMGWRVPMSVMLNLTHLRRAQPVVTVSEYLRLHNLSEDLELTNGQWDTERYHQNPSAFNPQGRPPSLHTIENEWYDPQGLNRVDRLSDDMKFRGNWDSLLGNPNKGESGGWPSTVKADLSVALAESLSGRQYILEFENARQILRAHGIHHVNSDEGLVQFLNDLGWEVLYTFDGALGMDYVKNVVTPIKQVAPRDSIRGFVDDYYHFNEDVLLLRGEIHYERKPAGLRFASSSARDAFARLVLFHMRHTDSVMELSETMARRMQELVGGRMWMGAHMRRGDFVRYNWVMQSDFGEHLQRIKDRLNKSKDVLYSITPEVLSTYAVPDVVANIEYVRPPPPVKDDLIYVATDERDPDNLAYLRENGVILASDLITIEDRRRFGWPLLITDVLGIVEQDLLARSAFFYAHALSSVAGGIVNIRAANGADPRTSVID